MAHVRSITSLIYWRDNFQGHATIYMTGHANLFLSQAAACWKTALLAAQSGQIACLAFTRSFGSAAIILVSKGQQKKKAQNLIRRMPKCHSSAISHCMLVSMSSRICTFVSCPSIARLACHIPKSFTLHQQNNGPLWTLLTDRLDPLRTIISEGTPHIAELLQHQRSTPCHTIERRQKRKQNASVHIAWPAT